VRQKRCFAGVGIAAVLTAAGGCTPGVEQGQSPPSLPALSHKASGDPVCAAWQGAGLNGTALLYSGETELRCGEPLAVSAVLVDSHGAPLAGRVLTFTLGAQSVQGTTAGNGSASATLTPSSHPSNTLAISYAGDAVTSASQTRASLAVESGTRLVGLGPSKMGTGGDQPVYVTLEGAADGKPLPGRLVTFIMGDVTATGTTGGDGIARATLRVPSDKAARGPGPSTGLRTGLTLSAAYGGDRCAEPASASINVTISATASSSADAGPAASAAGIARAATSSPPALTATLSALPVVSPGEALSYTLAVRKAAAWIYNIYMYMGTPDGTIRKFDPFTMSQSDDGAVLMTGAYPRTW
jgi:hypothetical protein